MQRKTFSVLTAIMVAVVIFQLSGCSAIIDGISVAGDIASLKKDAAKKKYIIILPSAVHTIKPGTRIYVLLWSGALVRGKYLDLVRVPTEEYAASYAKCREQIKEEIVLPELGETITVITKTGKQHELEFLGFDYGTILTRIERMGKTRTFKENIGLIKNIVDSRGNIIGVEAVRKLISEGKISLLSSGFIIRSKVGRTQIAWEDIYQIQKKKSISPRIVALILGVVVVGGILVIFIKESIDKKMEEACTISAVTRNSPMYAYLNSLRDFRDKYLMPNKLGRALVGLYYKYSPYFADLIVKHKALKVVVRISLLPLIALSYSMLRFGPIITAVMLGFICMLPIFLISFFRRRISRVEAKSAKALASLD